MNIELVRQEQPEGCGLACLAMVTGATYEQVRAAMRTRRYVWLNGERVPGDSGIHNNVLDHYLARHGFWLQRRYRSHVVAPPRPGAARRHRWTNIRAWPCAPWAPVHIAEVKQPSGNGHYVVMRADGGVLDPLRDGVHDLREWSVVNNIVGLIHA